MGNRRCWGVQSAVTTKRIARVFDCFRFNIINMDKLFALFVRYSLLPEKEFTKQASKMIYSMAEFAEDYE